MHSATRRPPDSAKKTGSNVPAGSVTDEQFRAAFTAVPEFKYASSKDLLYECQRLSGILANTSIDWDKRNKALQQVRSLLVAGAADDSEFINQGLPLFEPSFLESVKDLRSQVCREACITVAFYAEVLGTRFWRICEPLIPTLMNLMQNSAKVMATSAINANHYIAKYVKVPKLLTLYQQYLSSKSKEIRRHTIDLFVDVINHWDTPLVERNMSVIEQAIKTSLYDADPQARENARRTFQSLQSAFPKSAEFLVQGLEPIKQRALLGGITSAASSSQSINSERDTLPHARMGLYNKQNAFYANRATSDLSPNVMKKLNLTSAAARQGRINPLVANRKQQAPSPLMKAPPARAPAVPAPKKHLPMVPGSASKSTSSKSISQPNSRSTSPGRMRIKSRIPAPADSPKAHRDPSPRASAQQRAPTAAQQNINQRDIVKALKNVDLRSRVVPNVIRHDATYATTPQKPRPLANGGMRAYSGAPPPDAVFGSSPAQSPFGQKSNGSGRHSEGLNGTQFHFNNDASADSKWSYESAQALANDIVRQDTMIRDICDVLSSENGAQIPEDVIDRALNALSRMIRDDAITLWDDHFGSIVIVILQAIENNEYSKNTKQSALKALKSLIVSQHHRMISKQELVTLKVLNAHNSADSLLVRAAEDCAGALAAHLPKQVSIKLLLSFMESAQSPPWKVAGAIKMLSRVIENLSSDEVKAQLATIIPRLMRCYESPESIVRRACVICLVAMSDNVGMEPLRPFLSAPTMKLVEVYRERMENNQK